MSINLYDVRNHNDIGNMQYLGKKKFFEMHCCNAEKANLEYLKKDCNYFLYKSKSRSK